MTGTWEPIREAHSIESVAAVVTFPEPLNDIVLRKMLRAADANAENMNLPIRETIAGFQFNLPPSRTSRARPSYHRSHSDDGCGFQKTRD
jgi:hypothetical protein